MNDVLDQLKRWQALAEKSPHGAAAVDYVTLRNAVQEIERLLGALCVAVGLISTMPQFSDKHPQEVMEWIEDVAARVGGGDGKSK